MGRIASATDDLAAYSTVRYRPLLLLWSTYVHLRYLTAFIIRLLILGVGPEV